MLRKFVSAVTTTVAVAALAVSTTPAAVADNPLCPTNTFCLFKDINYGGGRFVFTSTTNVFSNLRWDTGGSVDNASSSAINNLNYTVVLYETSYVPCLGLQWSLPPHSELSNFTRVVPPNQTRNVNDIFSCVYWY